VFLQQLAFLSGGSALMTLKNTLKTMTLIAAVAFWNSPNFAAETSKVQTYKAGRFVASSAKADRGSRQTVDASKIAWNTGPLILGIGF
jgi:hypothetical protein